MSCCVLLSLSVVWIAIGLCEIQHGAGIMTNTELDSIYNELSHLHDENWGTYDANDEYMMSDLDDNEWENDDEANYYSLAKDIYAETSDLVDKQHMLDIDEEYMSCDKEDDKYKYSTHSVFVLKMANFDEAERYCQTIYGTHVATVGSQAKNDKMAKTKKQAWIGLNNQDEWQSGSKAEFRNFNDGEAGTGRCTSMGKDGKWHKTSCQSKHFFWCDNKNVPKPGTGENTRDGKIGVSKNIRYLTDGSVRGCTLVENGKEGLNRHKSFVYLKVNNKDEFKLISQKHYYLVILRDQSRKLAHKGCYVAILKIIERMGEPKLEGNHYTVKVRVREASPTEYLPSADFDIQKQRLQNNGIEEHLIHHRPGKNKKGKKGKKGKKDDDMSDLDDVLKSNGLTQLQEDMINGNYQTHAILANEIDLKNINNNNQKYLSGDDLIQNSDDFDFDFDQSYYAQSQSQDYYSNAKEYIRTLMNDASDASDASDAYDVSQSQQSQQSQQSRSLQNEQMYYNENDLMSNEYRNLMSNEEIFSFLDDRASLLDNYEDFYHLDENDEEYHNYIESYGYEGGLHHEDDEEWGWKPPLPPLPPIPHPRIALDAAARLARDAKDAAARAARIEAERLARIAREAAERAAAEAARIAREARIAAEKAAAETARIAREAKEAAAKAAAAAAAEAARIAQEQYNKAKTGLVTAANAVGEFAASIADNLAFEGYVDTIIELPYNEQYTKQWTHKIKETIAFGNIGEIDIDTFGQLTLTAGLDFNVIITLTMGGRWSVITFAIEKIKAVVKLEHHLIFTFIMDMQARVNVQLNFIEIGVKTPITTMIGVVPLVWRPFLKPYIGFTLNSKLTFTFNVGYKDVWFQAGFVKQGNAPLQKILGKGTPTFVRNWSLTNGEGTCGIRVDMNPYIGAEFLITMYGTFTFGVDIKVNGNAVVSLPVDKTGKGQCDTRPMQAGIELSPNIEVSLIARITKIFGITLPENAQIDEMLLLFTIPLPTFNVYVNLPSAIDSAFAVLCNC